MAIEDFYDPGALSSADWWGRNAPSFLGGVQSGYGDPGTVDASGDPSSAVSSRDVASALSAAGKIAGGASQQSSGPTSSPNVGGASQAVSGRSNSLQALLQLLMARQQAYQQAGQAGTGAVLPQTQRMTQPGLLGV